MPSAAVRADIRDALTPPTVVALLMWFYLAGFSVMLGALINVEFDRYKRLVQARKARNLALQMARERAAAKTPPEGTPGDAPDS